MLSQHCSVCLVQCTSWMCTAADAEQSLREARSATASSQKHVNSGRVESGTKSKLTSVKGSETDRPAVRPQTTTTTTRPTTSGGSGGSSEPKPVKFEGIGPTDEKTGVPIATRTVCCHGSNLDLLLRLICFKCLALLYV